MDAQVCFRRVVAGDGNEDTSVRFGASLALGETAFTQDYDAVVAFDDAVDFPSILGLSKQI